MTKTQTIQMKIVPIKVKAWNEQLEIWTRVDETDAWYPLTFTHIDTFHKKGQRDIYELLNDGETVELEVTMKVIGNEDE